MSSLGTKIKEAFGTTHSPEAAEGDADYRIPGSFQTDGMARPSVEGEKPSAGYSPANLDGVTHESSMTASDSNHMKRHKPNDPRGWSESEKTTRGHRQTDSGADLTDLAPVPHSQHREPAVGGGRHYAPQETICHSQDTAVDGRAAPGRGSAPAGAGTAAAYGLLDRDRNRESPGHERDASKPGVMAGASHRPGDNSQTTREQIYDKPAATEGSGCGSPATGLAAGETLTADSAPQSVRSLITNASGGSMVAHKDPYWGDIPRGAGVYNTVTGHGSAEDEARAHRSTEATESKTAPTTISTTTPDPSQQRAFVFGSQGKPTHTDMGNPEESRFKDSLAGASAGAGAGITASELAHNQRAEKDPTLFDKTNEPEPSKPREEKESEVSGIFHRGHKEEKGARHKEEKVKGPKQEKESKVASVFHRDHKDEKEPKTETKREQKDDKCHSEKHGAAVAAATAYAVHEKDSKNEKGVQPEQPKEKKESKLHALFHRSHKDKDEQPAKEGKVHRESSRREQKPAEVLPYANRGDQHVARGNDDTRVPPSTQRASDATSTAPASRDMKTPAREKDSRYGPDLAAAEAGAGAEHAAAKLEHRDQDKTSDLPDRGRSTTAHPAQSTLSSTNPATTGQGWEGQYNVMQSSGTTSGVKTHGDASSNAGTTPVYARREQQNAPAYPSHNGAKAATAGAAAAGVGAAAYCSQKDDKPTETVSSKSPLEDPATKLMDFARNETAKDTPAAGSMAAGAGTIGSRGVSEQNCGAYPTVNVVGGTLGSTTPPMAHPSISDAAANRSPTSSGTSGQYNILSSGTPSGVNTGDAQAEHKQATPAMDSDTAEQDVPHRSAMAAAGGEAAAGTGTSAYSSSHHEVKSAEPKPAKNQQPVTVMEAQQTQNNRSVPPVLSTMAAGSGSKLVLHKCQNCGEENDISHYFQK